MQSVITFSCSNMLVKNTHIPKLKHVVGVDTKVLDFRLVRRQEMYASFLQINQIYF